MKASLYAIPDMHVVTVVVPPPSTAPLEIVTRPFHVAGYGAPVGGIAVASDKAASWLTHSASLENRESGTLAIDPEGVEYGEHFASLVVTADGLDRTRIGVLLRVVPEEPDPFTLLCDAIWSLLESEPAFVQRVALRNRIRFTPQTPWMKQEVSESDYPMARVISTSGTPHYAHTSSSHSSRDTFEIQVSTGSPVLTDRFFPLKWAVFRAMSRWEEVRESIQWRGKPFVELPKLLTAREGLAQSDVNQGIENSWATLWACQIDTKFSRSDFRS